MTYADRQRISDATYTEAYKTWVASLPPEERARLDEGGIAEPDTSRKTATRQTDELRLQLTAAPDTTPTASDSEISNPKSQIASSATQAADVLAAFCARIRAHPNPLLAFDAACFASGLMDVEGLSETDLARRHRVTKAAFSKLVIQWAETFGLPPSRGMRSRRARASYRRARLTSLARQKHDRQAA